MFVGLDCGTSGIKALLVDEAGRPVADHTAPLTNERPRSGWSEQDPRSWLAAAGDALDALARDHDLSAVRGIGLAGQMHGATLLGADDTPLRPCMLWNDTRAAAQAERLDTPRAREITGNIVFPGFTAPKAMWVAENEPHTWDEVASILLPKDFIRLWLTGEKVSEMSDASGTSWLDVGARAWSDEMLAASGCDANWMPRLVEGSEPSGALRGELAARWGTERVVVAGGAGDNAGAACGTGVVAPGSAFLSLGTSGVLFATTESYAPNAESAVHAFAHALPGTWHQMAVILAATDSLNWLSRVLAEEAGSLADGAGEIGEGDPLFLPYLGGERTPHNDAAVRGALIGLAHETDRASVTRAIMEGVAHAFRDGLDAMAEAGTRVESAIAVGGGARSLGWLQMMADTLDITVKVPAGGEFGGALGAARLAELAVDGGDPREVCAPPLIGRAIEPRREAVERQAARHGRYRALYPAISNM